MVINKGKLTNQFKYLLDQSNSYLNNERGKENRIAAIYIILSLLTLSFFGIFAIGPTLSTISELEKEHYDNQIVIQQLETKSKNLNSLNENYQTIQKDLSLVELAIPSTAKVAILSRQLETLALQNSLSVERLSTGLLELYPAKNVNSPIFSYSFSQTVTGNQENIGNFIKQIINIDRIVSVKRISMEAHENSIIANIDGSVFFFKQ